MSLDPSDIQGNILRGYRASVARHFAVQINSASEGRRFVASLVPKGRPQRLEITTEAAPSSVREWFLNIGFTCDGLRGLQLPDAILRKFPQAFREGPARRASTLGDVEESNPIRWELGGPRNPPIHFILSVHVKGVKGEDPGELTCSLRKLGELTESFEGVARNHHLGIVHRVDARALPDKKVHFGYKDGLSQPRIDGVPGSTRDGDGQAASSPGEFLLGCGHPNQFDGDFLGDLPPGLGRNGSYFALRILEQDVHAFETYLAQQSSCSGRSRDYLAARMLGRWPDGTPLRLSPDGPSAQPHEQTSNAFGYAGDDEGVDCPIGSHIRRLNPRDSLVIGKPRTRRIIRRGMPYGPPYDPKAGGDGKVRGLIGLFICGDLEQQFEFLQEVYINGDTSRARIRDTRDPLMGAHRGEPHDTFTFRCPQGEAVTLRNLPRFVHTRGSVYGFMPGINGLKYLASIGSER